MEQFGFVEKCFVANFVGTRYEFFDRGTIFDNFCKLGEIQTRRYDPRYVGYILSNLIWHYADCYEEHTENRRDAEDYKYCIQQYRQSEDRIKGIYISHWIKIIDEIVERSISYKNPVSCEEVLAQVKKGLDRHHRYNDEIRNMILGYAESHYRASICDELYAFCEKYAFEHGGFSFRTSLEKTLEPLTKGL